MSKKDTKYEEIKKSLSSSMRMKLDNIGNNLAYGKASVMVGAGFTKNAEMDETVSIKDWNGLAEVFFEKLYSKKPSDKDLAFQTPMRLASLIATSFGRQELDRMIYKALPDERITPGKAHKLLLKLNWKDIFTTNYDRLLEDTASKIYKFYNVVTNKETLLYTESPRIIKLHGSFPDIHPFIMTEEDYRTYPQKYPEFVNTIRQALIERVLCLIGFSGNDPNFLAWIGWLRDVMKNLSHPIYLITYNKDFHSSEQILLLKRNIDIINLAEIEDCDNYEEALIFLFEYLKEKEKDTITPNKIDYRLKYQLDDEEKIKETIAKAQNIRKSYPGWLFLPTNKFTDFDDCVRDFPTLESQYNKIENNQLRLELLYEIDWRLSISLTPKNIKWYIQALEQLNYNGEDTENIRVKKDTLKISLLSIYRYHLNIEKFRQLVKTIQVREDVLPFNLYRRYLYEQGLFAVAIFDDAYALQIINKWKISRFDYIGAIWKSRLLVLVGRIKAAEELLNKTLQVVKRQLVLLNTKDKPLLSSCKYQIDAILRLLFIELGIYQKNEQEQSSFYRTLNFFTEELISQINQHAFRVEQSFNIGRRTKHWSMAAGGFNRNYLNSFRGARLYEVGGFPFGLPNLMIESQKIKLICQQLIPFQFYYVVSIIIQCYNIKLLEEVFTREVLETVSREEIDFLHDLYLSRIKEYLESNNKSLKDRAHLTASLLCYTSVKASQKYILPLVEIMTSMNILKSIYYKDNYLQIVYDCLDVQSIEQVAPNLYAKPITLSRLEKDICFPNTDDIDFTVPSKAVTIVVEGLKSTNKKIREAAYYRISRIYEKLSKKNKNKVAKGIINWRNEEDQTLNMRYSYKFVPYNLGKDKFSPSTIVAKQLDEFNQQNFKYDNSSRFISCFKSSLSKFIPFCEQMQPEEIERVIARITEFFTENEEYLKKDDSKSFFGGLRSFSNKLMVTVDNFISRVSLKSLDKELLETFAKEINSYVSYGFRCLSILATLDLHLGYKCGAIDKMQKTLFIDQYEETIDALTALNKLIKDKKENELIKKIFNYIAISNSESVSLYIWFLRNIPDKKDLGKEFKKSCEDLLDNLYMKRNNALLSISNQVNIEYEVLRLVQVLLKENILKEEDSNVKKWLEVNKSPDTFNDVRFK